MRQVLFDVQWRDAIGAKIPQHFVGNRSEFGRWVRERLVPAVLVLIDDAEQPLSERFLFRVGHHFGSPLQCYFEDLVHC